MFLLYSLILSLNIIMTLCDRTCDCQEIELLKETVEKEMLERNVLMEIVQKEMLERKMESSRLLVKIRRLEATQRSIPIPDKLPEHGLADRLQRMETKFEEIDEEMNENSEVRQNMADIVLKGLRSEKQNRIDFIADVKGMVANFKAETITYIEQCSTNMTASLGNFRQNMLREMEGQIDLKVRSVTSDLNDLEQDFLETSTAVSKLNDMVLQGRTDYKEAFTATGIEAGEGDVARFPNVIYNYGGGYSSITGKFTCKIPGIYHFAVTLSINQDKDHKFINCLLYVNNASQLQLYAKKELDSHNTYPATAAGTFHLKNGDTVYVGDGQESEIRNTYNDSSTIFTGFLVSADN